MADTTQMRSIPFVLRVVEFVFSIIAFAVVAEYAGDFWGSADSKIGWTIFTGVTTMLICMGFIAAYLMGLRSNRGFNLIELIVTSIWWVFWLAALGCMTDLSVDIGDYDLYDDLDSKIAASAAFCWLTWFLWTASLFFCVMDFKKADGGAVPAEQPVGAVVQDAKPAGVPPV